MVWSFQFIHYLCGMWRAAVSGPILFVLYIIDITALIESYGLSCHLYAGDTQVDGSCPVAAVDTLSSNVSACVRAISSWATSSRLLLNPDKTETLWCATIHNRNTDC